MSAMPTMRLVPVALLALCSTPVLAEQIACEGAFGIDSSEERLIEIFGADNVWTGKVHGPEAMKMLATEVFRDDPKKRLQFVWWDEANRRDPSYIELSGKMVTPGGVRQGLTVSEVQALNGEPFKLSGFGWDYGGGAWIESGALTDLPGDCHLSLTFSPSHYPPGTSYDAITGDIEVQSTDPLLETVGAYLSWVAIGYPHPDFRD
jgi:hypothetical protein